MWTTQPATLQPQTPVTRSSTTTSHPTSTTAVLSVNGDGNGNDGDVVTITLNPSETVGTPTCTFTDTSGAMADTSVTYGTVEGTDHHTAAVTIDNSDANGAVGFSCTYADTAGNSIASAITSASSGSVTIDNTHPSISSVEADWGAYLNAAEDNSDGTITVITSGAENGETVTITGMGFTDTCSVQSNTCDATILAADLQGLSSGTTYTITVNVDDTAGNAATADTGDTFIYDNVAPTSTTAVESVSGSGDANDGDVFTVTLTRPRQSAHRSAHSPTQAGQWQTRPSPTPQSKEPTTTPQRSP